MNSFILFRILKWYKEGIYIILSKKIFFLRFKLFFLVSKGLHVLLIIKQVY